MNSNPATSDRVPPSPAKSGKQATGDRLNGRACSTYRKSDKSRRIPEAVKRLEKERRKGDELLDYDGWKLPGVHEEEKGKDCGQLLLFECCGHNCPGRKVVRRRCLRLVCPHCWRAGISRMVKRIVSGKIIPYQEAKKLKKEPMADPSHLVLSPPKSWYGEPVQKIRKKAAELARRVGMEAGVAIVHPWRGKDGPKGAAWHEEPHVHFICFGWIRPERTQERGRNGEWVEKEGAKELYERTGWIAENWGRLRDKASIYRVVWYNLSHAATRPGRSSYQYYGALVHFKGVPVEENGHECIACGSPMAQAGDQDQEWIRQKKPPPAMLYYWSDPIGFYLATGGTWIRIRDERSLKTYLDLEPEQVGRDRLYSSGIGFDERKSLPTNIFHPRSGQDQDPEPRRKGRADGKRSGESSGRLPFPRLPIREERNPSST